MAEAQVKQLRKKHPTKTTEEIIAILERRYLSETTSIGVGSGAAAAVPGAGTVAALGLTAVDAGSFLTATAVHVFAVMKVLDIELADIEHERALVMSIVLGGSGSRTIERVAQRTGKHWGKLLVDSTPNAAIKQINKVLGRHFVTKYGTKQGIIVLGKVAPFGIGAAVGGGLNHLMARGRWLLAVKPSLISGNRPVFAMQNSMCWKES